MSCWCSPCRRLTKPRRTQVRIDVRRSATKCGGLKWSAHPHIGDFYEISRTFSESFFKPTEMSSARDWETAKKRKWSNEPMEIHRKWNWFSGTREVAHPRGVCRRSEHWSQSETGHRLEKPLDSSEPLDLQRIWTDLNGLKSYRTNWDMLRFRDFNP